MVFDIVHLTRAGNAQWAGGEAPIRSEITFLHTLGHVSNSVIMKCRCQRATILFLRSQIWTFEQSSSHQMPMPMCHNFVCENTHSATWAIWKLWWKVILHRVSLSKKCLRCSFWGPSYAQVGCALNVLRVSLHVCRYTGLCVCVHNR
jgi:hypothetical protein